MNLVDYIRQAEQEAWRQHIKANSVMLNRTIKLVREGYAAIGGSIQGYPPMICGLSAFLTDELPDDIAFAVFFCYELIFAAIMLVFWFINNKVFILLLNIPGCIWFYWNFWNICKYKLGLCKAKTKNVILTSLSCFVVLVVILQVLNSFRKY